MKSNKEIVEEMLKRDGFTQNEIKLANLNSLSDCYLLAIIQNESDDYNMFKNELQNEIYFLTSNHQETIKQQY